MIVLATVLSLVLPIGTHLTVSAAVPAPDGAVLRAAALADPALNGATITWMKRSREWAFGSVVVTAENPESHQEPAGRLFLAHHEEGSWLATVQHTPSFAQLLPSAPKSLLGTAMKSTLRSAAQATSDAWPVETPAPLALPWRTGETWQYGGGPHPFATIPDEDQDTLVQASLDFSTEDGVVIAMFGGVVVRECERYQVNVISPDGWEIVYNHLSNIQVRTGDVIDAGDVLGQVGTGKGCSNEKTNAHVHISLNYQGIPQDIEGTSIGGWKVERDNGIYAGCLTKDGVRTCPGKDFVTNDGTVGQDETPLDPPEPWSTAEYCVRPEELAVVEEINRVRVDAGLQALVLGDTIHAAAQRHMDVNAAANLSELVTLADGTTWGENASSFAVGYIDVGFSSAGAEVDTAEAFLDEFRSSSMLGRIQGDVRLNSIAVAHAYNAEASHKHFWVVYLGHDREQTAKMCDASGQPIRQPMPTPVPASQRTVVTTTGPVQRQEIGCASAEVIAYFERINEDRAAAGRRPLLLGRSLTEAAIQHVSFGPEVGDLVAKTLGDGSLASDNRKARGFDFSVGIVGGGSNLVDPYDYFHGSDSWQDWIEEDGVNTIGIGYLYEPSQHHHYWVVYLGEGEDEAIEPCTDTTLLSAKTRVTAEIDEIVDGMTLRVKIAGEGVTVSLAGMNTADLDERVGANCVDVTAAERFTALLDGADTIEVGLVPETAEKRGRREGFVWVTQGEQRLLVNDVLIREGLADVRPFPARSPYIARLLAARAEAQAFARGIWADC